MMSISITRLTTCECWFHAFCTRLHPTCTCPVRFRIPQLSNQSAWLHVALHCNNHCCTNSASRCRAQSTAYFQFHLNRKFTKRKRRNLFYILETTSIPELLSCDHYSNKRRSSVSNLLTCTSQAKSFSTQAYPSQANLLLNLEPVSRANYSN